MFLIIFFPDQVYSEEQHDTVQLLRIGDDAAAAADTSEDLHFRLYGLVPAAVQLPAAGEVLGGVPQCGLRGNLSILLVAHRLLPHSEVRPEEDEKRVIS